MPMTPFIGVRISWLIGEKSRLSREASRPLPFAVLIGQRKPLGTVRCSSAVCHTMAGKTGRCHHSQQGQNHYRKTRPLTGVAANTTSGGNHDGGRNSAALR